MAVDVSVDDGARTAATSFGDADKIISDTSKHQDDTASAPDENGTMADTADNGPSANDQARDTSKGKPFAPDTVTPYHMGGAFKPTLSPEAFRAKLKHGLRPAATERDGKENGRSPTGDGTDASSPSSSSSSFSPVVPVHPEVSLKFEQRCNGELRSVDGKASVVP